MAGYSGQGPIGTDTNSPIIDAGTSALCCTQPPGPVGMMMRWIGNLALAQIPPHMTVFHPGVNHGHAPSRQWSKILADPQSSMSLNLYCKATKPTPSELIEAAKKRELAGKPLATEHLEWYLSKGGGRDFVEDQHIQAMLRRDGNVRALLSSYLPAGVKTGKYAGYFKLEQKHYHEDDGQDFRYAFGAIDRLDFEADFDTGMLHVWFQDRYEWHPVYSGLYTKETDDDPRETNCVHAAAVELKDKGAADFWMKGEATVPLALVVSTSGVPTKGSRDH